MKVAKKSPRKRQSPGVRATLTLTLDTYEKIDHLRGDQPRSVWVQNLIKKEEERRKRAEFTRNLNKQYTPAVCRQTLSIHDEFPVHEQ